VCYGTTKIRTGLGREKIHIHGQRTTHGRNRRSRTNI
jgi:hypothetical protein